MSTGVAGDCVWAMVPFACCVLDPESVAEGAFFEFEEARVGNVLQRSVIEDVDEGAVVDSLGQTFCNDPGRRQQRAFNGEANPVFVP